MAVLCVSSWNVRSSHRSLHTAAAFLLCSPVFKQCPPLRSQCSCDKAVIWRIRKAVAWSFIQRQIHVRQMPGWLFLVTLFLLTKDVDSWHLLVHEGNISLTSTVRHLAGAFVCVGGGCAIFPTDISAEMTFDLSCAIDHRQECRVQVISELWQFRVAPVYNRLKMFIENHIWIVWGLVKTPLC